jgi:hypothetical protein
VRALIAGFLVLGAVLLGGSTASGVGASPGFTPSGIVPHSGSAPTLRAPRAAGSFTCGSITCDAYETGINRYFTDVAHDNGGANNVYSVLNQYSDNTGNIAYNETFGGTYLDTTPYPASGCTASFTCLTEAQLETEIGKVLSAKGWTASGTNLFFIFLPSGVNTCFGSGGPGDACASNAFCAYHDSSASLIFAVEPFNAAWNCDGSSLGEGMPNGPEIDQTINTISHEQSEAITDPNQSSNAWYSSSGDEIGDLCSWSFGTPLGTTAGGQPYNQVINGHDYSLQLEYSNAANSNAGGCVSHLGGAVSPIRDGGTAPLTWHGGPVMRSNTVYTIYWLPAGAPSLSVAPAVTGTAAVGQQLSTTNGTWTDSPTSYAYRWQRCDNVGLNCTTILNATNSTYTLVTADAGHEIRSEVLASNAGGPAAAGYAPSTPTAVVIGKPAVTTVPKISGTAKVGNSLSVSTGVWTNAPTQYTYQWLRCTSGGTSCKKIGGATTESHMLSSGDAGHRLAVKVTATNTAGSTTAMSGKSSVIRK